MAMAPNTEATMDPVPFAEDVGCPAAGEFKVDRVVARLGTEKETAVAAKMVGARSGVLALLNSHKLAESGPADT